MTRVLVDTNTTISAFVWGGTPERLFALAEESQVTLLSSQPLVDELRDKLNNKAVIRQKIALSGQTAGQIMERFLLAVELVEPVKTIPANAVSDPKDVMVLAAAVGGSADYIVSGDKHLLNLGAYEGIPILRVADLLQQLSNSTA